MCYNMHKSKREEFNIMKKNWFARQVTLQDENTAPVESVKEALERLDGEELANLYVWLGQKLQMDDDKSRTAEMLDFRKDFHSLLEDIVEKRLTGEAEIERRLHSLARVPERFCRFVVMEFEGWEEGVAFPEELFAQLEEVFPGSNMTEFQGKVIVLFSSLERINQPTEVLDASRFQTLLEDWNAVAAISNATSQHYRLHTCYFLAQQTLKLGKALRPQQRHRIFSFEDYAEYFMIDLCFNSFDELLGHHDIIYLAHPDAILIARYDRKHGTNLLDVLYYYCLSSENIAKTAGLAYMHRNTATARMAKIRELIRADLSDGQIRQRMIFSCKILRYYEKYVQVDMEERLRETSGQEGEKA